MPDPPRRPLVAANWKMNPPDRATALALAHAVATATADTDVDVVLCPPAVWLDAVAATVQDSPIRIGAQNLHASDSGAFTGELSAPMLLGVADYVIVGHSERRRLFGETDADVAAKVGAAVAHGIAPIVAVGESAEERRAGQTDQVISRQVRSALSGLELLAGSGLVVAYEPVWAIGTGDPASGADAQAGAALIRRLLAEHDAAAADATRVLYGGSVAPELASTCFAQPDIDGALVGGASLDAEAFAAIVRAAAR
ncbi:MAG TPA: triose-phosphate isomerase [Candidatus Limnocylindria bacterium]|jgi:triosephosphate isomerase